MEAIDVLKAIALKKQCKKCDHILIGDEISKGICNECNEKENRLETKY